MRSDLLLDAVFTECAVGIVLCRLTDGRVLDANDAALRLVALPHDHVIGKTLTEMGLWAQSLWQLIIDSSPETPYTSHIQLNSQSGMVHQLAVRIERMSIQENAIAVIYLEPDRRQPNQAEPVREPVYGFQSLFNNSPSPMWIYDQQTLIFLEVNNAAVAAYGYSREEFLAMKITDIRSTDEVYQLLAELTQAMETTPQRAVIRTQYGANHKPKIGSVVEVRITAQLAEFAGRQAVYVVIEDNADFSRMQKSLIDTSNRLSAIYTSSPVPILGYDLEGYITDWNPAAEQVFGWTAEEAIGSSMPTILEDRRDTFRAQIREIARGKPLLGIETQRRRKDGRVLHVISSISPLYDANNEVVGIISVNQDITQRKQSEEQLRLAHQRVTEILESISDAFYALDHEWRFQYVNHKAEAWWHHDRDSLLGRSIWEVFPQTVGSESYEQHLRAAREREPIEFETVSPILNHWIDVSMYPSPGGLSVYFRDITQRKRLEAELARRTHEIEGLLVVSQKLSSVLDAEEVVRVTVQSLVSTLVHADAATLWLYDNSSDSLVLKAVAGPYAAFATGEVVIPAHGNTLADVFHTAEAKQTEQSAGTSVYASVQQAPFHLAHTSLCVPLIANNKALGVLCADSTVVGNPLDESDLRLLWSLATHTAIALENAELFEQLTSAQERTRKLSQQIIRAHEAERRRIARELHDELGQGLLLIKLDLEIIRDQLPDSMSIFRSGLEESIQLAGKVTEEMRALSMELRPAILDDMGLATALEWYARRFRERTGIETRIRHTQLNTRLSEEIETAVFRCVQEALTNALRHAAATMIDIDVTRKEFDLYVTVQDNGTGFKKDILKPTGAVEAGGQGLSSMVERLRLIEGELNIASVPGEGTRLDIRIPLPASSFRGAE
jgi:PAS domain S-box-containing protein